LALWLLLFLLLLAGAKRCEPFLGRAKGLFIGTGGGALCFGPLDLKHGFVAQVMQPLLYQLVVGFEFFFVCLVKLTAKVIDARLGSPEVLNHVDQLTQQIQRLLDILFDELDHRRFEVFFDDVYICIGQR